jgi:hypothetical protein
MLRLLPIILLIVLIICWLLGITIFKIIKAADKILSGLISAIALLVMLKAVTALMVVKR